MPWRRGRGYDVAALSDVYTANDAWARLVFKQLADHVDDLGRSAASASASASSMPATWRRDLQRSSASRLSRVSAGQSPDTERQTALRDLAAGRIQVIFSVDLFNEGVDVPTVDTLLMLRPTESPTLFLQQLGRGLRQVTTARPSAPCSTSSGSTAASSASTCRYRALLGGTRARRWSAQMRDGFPFLPAGCHMELDRVASEIVLRSIQRGDSVALAAKVEELRALMADGERDVTSRDYLDQTGLDLDDIYAGNHSWSDLREAAGLAGRAGRPARDRAAARRRRGCCTSTTTHGSTTYRSLARERPPPDVRRDD